MTSPITTYNNTSVRPDAVTNATLSTVTTVFDSVSSPVTTATHSVVPDEGFYGYGEGIDGYEGGFDFNNTNYINKDGGLTYDYDLLEGKYILDGFSFEKTIYLYVWGFLIILTTLANVLVILVLARRRMRNATNTILIAIAISDSLTGLVTLPTYIHAYGMYIDVPNEHGLYGERGVMEISENWCEGFMLIRYFVSRTFHTISVWLTVMLGFQRFVSVSFPFRANSLFSVKNTCILIVIIAVLSPFLHVYHTFDRKAEAVSHECSWVLEKNCEGGGCAYLWLTILLMHFIPCVLLVVFSGIMILEMLKATAKMKRSQMISNPKKLQRRDLESRRISFVVIIVVAVFLIPEIPYGIFLAVSVLLHQSGEELLDIKTNRQLICAYEVLVVLSFNANFWIYLVMNRRFRHGLARVFDPVIYEFFRCVNFVLPVRVHYERRPSESSLSGKSYPQNDATSHTGVSRSNSILTERPHNSATGTKSNSAATVEMKTYHFKTDSDSCVEPNGRVN